VRIAYVAGPYRSPIGPHGILANIMRARDIAVELWKQGYAVICPHANTFMMDGAAPDDVWLKGDLEIMRRCDLMVLVPGWEKSSGTRAEVADAVEHRIPVYVWQGGQICELEADII
jgi:hypothetical protein